MTQSACATSCIIDPMGGTDSGLALVLQPYCVMCVHMDRENTITLGEKVTEYYSGWKIYVGVREQQEENIRRCLNEWKQNFMH